MLVDGARVFWWEHVSSSLSFLTETLVPIASHLGAVAGTEVELKQSMTEKKIWFCGKQKRLRGRKY